MKSYIFPVIVVVLVVLGGVVFMKSSPVPNTAQPQAESGAEVAQTETASTENTNDTIDTSIQKTFTMSEVARHNSKESCYSVVRGKVYDLTSWISKHPGGQSAILSLCGKDGTSAFEGQHGGNEKPEARLASFEIGVLVP